MSSHNRVPGAPGPTTPRKPPLPRPIGLTIATWILGVQGLAMLVAGGLELWARSHPQTYYDARNGSLGLLVLFGGWDDFVEEPLPHIFVAVGLLLVALCVGLMRRRRWALAGAVYAAMAGAALATIQLLAAVLPRLDLDGISSDEVVNLLVATFTRLPPLMWAGLLAATLTGREVAACFPPRR